jgi:hypothetical protein
VEIVVGCVVLLASIRAFRRRARRAASADTPKGLERLDETNSLLAVLVGAFMLTYSLTLAAAAEILKAHVSTADSAGTLGRKACPVAAMAARTLAHRRPRRVDGHRRHRGRARHSRSTGVR